MVSIKRKNISDSGNVGPLKKFKPAIPTSQSLVLKDEETFPRGGASVLTSLEHKQIRIQATQDALFEQTTGNKSARNDFGDEDNEDDVQNETAEVLAKTSRKHLSKKKSVHLIGTSKDSDIRIEGLSFKVRCHMPSLSSN